VLIQIKARRKTARVFTVIADCATDAIEHAIENYLSKDSDLTRESLVVERCSILEGVRAQFVEQSRER
jgi:hypothetical protein